MKLNKSSILIAVIFVCIILFSFAFFSCSPTSKESNDKLPTVNSSNTTNTPTSDIPTTYTGILGNTLTPSNTEKPNDTATTTTIITTDDPIVTEPTTPNIKDTESITRGMSSEEVLVLLGMPSEVESSKKGTWILDDGTIFIVYFSNLSVHSTLHQKFVSPEKAALITEGMTYSEVVNITECEGDSIGYGAVIYKWRLSDGRALKIWFIKESTQAEKFIVSSIRIE